MTRHKISLAERQAELRAKNFSEKQLTKEGRKELRKQAKASKKRAERTAFLKEASPEQLFKWMFRRGGRK